MNGNNEQIKIINPTGGSEYDEVLMLECVVGLYLIIGVYFIIFGYRLFRMTMFSSGFFFALYIVYPVCKNGDVLPELGNKIVSACAGLLFGLITMLIQFVGLFISGLHSGLLKGASILVVYSNAFVTDSPTAYWISLIVCLISGISTACLNVYCKKGLTIISTSVYGGALVAMGIDHFLEDWAMVKWIYRRVLLEPCMDPPPRLLAWIILSVWPITSFGGMLIQYFYTGKGIHHDKGLITQRRRCLKAVPLCEQNAELKKNKYRHLYQMRTAHGDVISRSNVAALQQKKKSFERWKALGESSTLKSDSTHLYVLAVERSPIENNSDQIHRIRAGD